MANNKKILIANKGACSKGGIIAILIILLIIVLAVIFQEKLGEFMAFLLGLIRSVFPSEE